MKRDCETVVIGGGPAGLASAIKAKELGLDPIIIENRERLGGIPLQCVHPGFGLHYYREDLTGTEFIHRFITQVKDRDIPYYTNAHVTGVQPMSDIQKKLKVFSPEGVLELRTPTIVYATGARERHVYEVGITGKRLAGVYSAGEAQAMMDLYGVLPGKNVVIIGSGDVGLIMARRFALEGANVKAVIEMLPYPGGLTRNVMQCLEDFDIPLRLRHVVKRIEGEERVERVIVAEVDEHFRSLPHTRNEIACDTVITAVGLVPYIDTLKQLDIPIDPATNGPIVNEYLETKTMPGIFVAGNALLINDLVDYVVEQGERAANGAQVYVENQGIPITPWKPIQKGRNIRSVAPHYVSGTQKVRLYIRVQEPEEGVALHFPEIGKTQSLSSVTPAEMLRVTVSESKMKTIEDTLTVKVQKRNEGRE